MTVGAEIGVFGGSGFYSLLEDATHHNIRTPYGPPSGPVAIGDVGGRRVAFLARHGPSHELPPHRVNFRANVWAMRDLGVSRLFGPCAAGSLQPHVAPGDFLIADQLVDRTWGRPDTFFDGPDVNHVSFADPYCPQLRAVAVETAETLGEPCHNVGTVVVIQGPRFSTRAESGWFRSAGWDAVNMTQYPEAFLARELGICYAALVLITDYDTGVEGVEGTVPVTMDQVFATLEDNIARTRRLLLAAIPAVPAARSCACGP